MIEGGTVSNCAAVGDISGGEGNGAFVGRIYGGTVETSTAEGSASGSNAVGGFVGQNQGQVQDCYAEASAAATNDGVGGFVGEIFEGASISNVYAVGEPSGESAVGGLAGANSGTLESAYWDTEATGQSAGVGSGTEAGTGLATAEMTGDAAAENMSALDFGSTWTTTNSYPQLAWE